MKNTSVLLSLGLVIFLIGFGLGYFFDRLSIDGFFLIKKSVSSVSSGVVQLLDESPSPQLIIKEKVEPKVLNSPNRQPTPSPQLIAATLKIENSPLASPTAVLSPLPEATPLISSTPEPSEDTNPSSRVLISEIQITGNVDEKEDFVELYNANGKEVDLTGWYLQRKTKTGSAYATFASKSLFANKKIPSQGYFLIGRAGYFMGLADVFVDHPLTEDNALVLKNPDGEIVDKVGWGLATDYSYVPTVNPDKGQTIGRKVVDHLEQDSQNNAVDFELNESTPRAENEKYVAVSIALPSPTPTLVIVPSPSVVPSVTPEPSISPSPTPTPEVTSDSTPSPTPESSPEISPTPEASPSPQESPIPSPLESPTPLPSPVSLQNIVINEIQTYGTSSSDQFIELYNPNKVDIDLSGYSLKKKTSTGTESNLVSTSAFSGNILAHGFFLIVPQSYSGSVAANLQYSGASFSLAEKNNTVLLYDAAGMLVDKVGFGSAGGFETAAFTCDTEAQCIPRTKSIERKEQGIDTDDNSEDFQILEIPSPGG